MTETASRWKSGNTALNPKLLALLERGDLDWDNPRHREAYLRAWVKGAAPEPAGDPQDTRPGTGSASQPS